MSEWLYNNLSSISILTGTFRAREIIFKLLFKFKQSIRDDRLKILLYNRITVIVEPISEQTFLSDVGNLHNTSYNSFADTRQIQISEVQVDGNRTVRALANV